MSSETQPSRISALIWLLVIFGSILVIGWYAWSFITNTPVQPNQDSSQANEEDDPNTFSIDEQLDMLDQ